jgi:ATP-dependent RNA helicase DeaD
MLEEGFNSTDIASALLHHLQGGEVSPPSAKPSAPPPNAAPRPAPKPLKVPPAPAATRPPAAAPAPAPEKSSRTVSKGKTRLWMSIGKEKNVVPLDIVTAITAASGLPGKIIGTIDIRERPLFADVSNQHAKTIIEKMNKTEIKGHRVKVKEA